MAKLSTPTNAGYNAGKSYYAKPMRISDIIIDPEISQIFKIHTNVRDEILDKIRGTGYDNSQPVVVWKGCNLLVDGHTRLAAASAAGLEEIPVTEMEFECRADALLYTFERQVLRRNLTGAEILKAAQTIPDKKNSNGKGRAAEQIAQRLGVSPSTIYQARAISKNAPDEVKQAVENGDMSIKAAYNKTIAPKEESGQGDNPSTEFHVSDTQGLPEHVKFLKGAVILLVEGGLQLAAKLLVNHYLKKREKEGFLKLLPENINETLKGIL